MKAAGAAPHAPSVVERQNAYARYIRRRFKVDSETASQIVKASSSAGARFRIEPALLLAIMAVESSYDPHAFNGTDVGLMQVNPHLHADKVAQVGGGDALYEIDKNIYVGAWVLREIRNRSPSMREALLHYSGSRRLGRKYPDRVEEQRLALERQAGVS